MSTIGGAVLRAGRAGRGLLPAGQLLTPEVWVWARRHRGPWTVWLLWLHAAGIAVLALARGMGVAHALQEGSLVAVFALPAAHPAIGRRARSAAAVLGVLAPNDVFNHPAAQQAPWKGALGQRRLPGQLAAQRAPGGRDQPPGGAGPHRPAHRCAQPAGVGGGAAPGAGAGPADGHRAVRGHDRPGRLQGPQRPLRPPGRRPGPKEAASAWRAEVRSTDLLARYGGEELVLLLPACALEDAVRIVERPRVVTPLVTCSAGLACWNFQEDGAKLVERADQDLYAAKAKGRNRHVLASRPTPRRNPGPRREAPRGEA